jgi:hypothetical protein
MIAASAAHTQRAQEQHDRHVGFTRTNHPSPLLG